MKTSKVIFSFLCATFLNMPLHAQFYTVGTYNHKRIKTNNPPKPVLAPMDSVSLVDSVATAEPSVHKNADDISLVSLPLKSIRINSRFGMRQHPIYHRQIMHNGIDLQARYENVYSMFPGTVIKVGQDGRSGRFITIRTGDYTISYCHLSQQLVRVKDFVSAGTTIAISGNTGASTGPHLHLTTKKDGKAFDPTILLNIIADMR